MARAVVVLYWATWPVRVAANPQAYDVWRGIWMERSKQMIERLIRDLSWRWGLVKEPTNARDEWTYENERGEYIQPPVPPEKGNNKISSINLTSSILHPETDSRGNTGCFYSLIIRSLMTSRSSIQYPYTNYLPYGYHTHALPRSSPSLSKQEADRGEGSISWLISNGLVSCNIELHPYLLRFPAILYADVHEDSCCFTYWCLRC